jgi:hypothetical protein
MPEPVLRMLQTLVAGGKKVRFAAAGLMRPRKKRKNLVLFTELAKAGEFRAVIDRRDPLQRIAQAHRYVGKGHKKGNVVTTVETSGKT